jgi:hypothetical protein
MFSLFGRKTSGVQKVIAVLDIGSGSVGGALCRLNREGLPELLFAIREDMPFKMTRAAKELSTDAAKAAKNVLDAVKKSAALYTEAEKVTPLPIEHVAIFLAAPWSTTTIKSLRFARSKPFSMNEDALRRILADEVRVAESAIKAQTRVIERIATGLTLNGYPTQEISGVPVTSAEVTLAVTLAAEAFIDLLEEKIGDPPRGAERTYHSFVLPASYALALWRPESRETVVIDARSEMTELMVVRGGVPCATATVPIGHNHLLRTLKSRTGMGKNEGMSTLKLAQLDGTRLSDVMRFAIAEAGTEWAKELGRALQALSLGAAIPSEAHLFADPNAQHWFSSALAKDPLTASISSGPIAPLGVLGKELAGLAVMKGVAPDPHLLSELIFADARLDEGRTLSFSPKRDLVLTRPRATMNRV